MRCDLSRTSDERGAVLVLVAAVTVVLLMIGAIAVDLSALERRGQTLQNTADAAALAGVDVWIESGNQTQATSTIQDVIAQNGIDQSADVDVQIAFPSPDTVTVVLADDEPDVFLAGVVGLGGTLERVATAEIDRCDTTCNRTALLPEPLGVAVAAPGFGDGYIPTALDDRLYGINHHDIYIGCVDRRTSQPCWSGQLLFWNGGGTANRIQPSTINDRIYYVGWNAGSRETVMTCWDHAADSRCTEQAVLGDHGHATLVQTDGRLFAFTSDRKAFCRVPGTLQSCPGYVGGKDISLAAHPGWVDGDQGAYNSETLVHNGRIYHTLSNQGEVFLHCWNPTTNLPCASFSAPRVNLTGADIYDPFNSGRLFLARDTAGTPTSICSMGERSLECYDFDSGDRVHADESQFDDLHGAAVSKAWQTWPGLITYHEFSNRLITVNSIESLTYCHDFTTQSYCGETLTNTTLGLPRTYGYIGDGRCLIGLGHESIFFSIKPDLAGSCDGSSRTVSLLPCNCSGALTWPPIEAAGTGLVEVFEARVLGADGSVLLPDDDRDWIDLTTDELDLSSIDLSLAPISIEFFAESLPGEDAWLGADDPGLVIGFDGSPKLVD